MISCYNNIGDFMLIVIPAYNPDYHLIKTLKSLKSKLNNNPLTQFVFEHFKELKNK